MGHAVNDLDAWKGSGCRRSLGRSTQLRDELDGHPMFGPFQSAIDWSYPVQHAPLTGRLILLVEDEALIALDVARALRAAGASVVAAGYVESGLYTTEHPYLSAAVIDLHLGGEDGTAVCRRLRQLGVPFVVHSGDPARNRQGMAGCTCHPEAEQDPRDRHRACASYSLTPSMPALMCCGS
jgi:CheY-like chemotaxis protein